MLVNHSTHNASFVSAHLSSGNSYLNLFMYCLTTRPSSSIFIAIDINIILIMLPLCVYILHHGIQQWLQKRSTSAAAMSHSDCFTYHMVAMELIGVFGYIMNLTGICKSDLNTLFIGDFLTCLTWFGQIFFHILTCLERYLAVVHPIVYLRLKNEWGIRIRYISISCAWMLSLVGMSLMMMTTFFYIVNFCLLISSFSILLFCNISVLWVLIRPGPGEQGKGREIVDQSKKKALYMITTILGVLGLRLTWNVIWEIIFLLGRPSDCVIMAVCVWFNLPSSLVLPLLFLHRQGRFGCGNDRQSGI